VDKKTKLYGVVLLVGVVAGVVTGYLINTGLGNDGFKDIIFWIGGSVIIVFVRIKTSPALKHIFSSND
jgi:high-affinity Fe2+/Pb2+ permease